MKAAKDLPRGFKGIWIPRDLYLAEDLTWHDKILLGEIDSLDMDEDRGCFASNEYLGTFLGLEAKTIANMISKLRQRKAIVDVFHDGHNRGLRSAFHRPDALGGGPADPNRSEIVKETEKILGFYLDSYTCGLIDEIVPARFMKEWLTLVKLRLVGNKSSQSIIKTRIGYWLGDFKKDLWRLEADEERTGGKKASATNMPNPAEEKLCDQCRETGGMIYVDDNGTNRLTRCKHKADRKLRSVK